MPLDLSSNALKVKPSSTLAITARIKELKKDGADIVGLGAGEPDFNTPESICEAGKRAIDSGFTKYTPASGMKELKEAICKKFLQFNNISYGINQIVVSNGAKHSLTNIFTAILNPGDEVIIPAPFWLSYPQIVSLAYGVPKIINTKRENSFKMLPREIEEAITAKTKAIILNTPSNPTGAVYTREELCEIARVAVKNDIYVISDEIYEYLVYGGREHVSIASLDDEIYKRTITCSGLSKTYAMTGWRIGYTGSSKEIARVMSNLQSHQTSNPSSISQMASICALSSDTDIISDMRKEYEERGDMAYDLLKQLPYIDVVKPNGAFYLFVDFSKVKGMYYKGERIESIANMAGLLLEDKHVGVVPCADFGAPDFVRLSYATSRDAIKEGIRRIADFIYDFE